MRLFVVSAGALALASLLGGCSHTTPQPAATSARQQAREQARAAAAAENQDRQELASIPPPSKNTYMAIHTRQSWENPFLVVSQSTVSLSMLYPDFAPANTPGSSLLRPVAARRRVLELRLSDLPEALAAMPENTWPYGRVIAVEEDPTETRQNRAQVRRNVEATMQLLNDLGVVVYEWPGTNSLH